MADKLKAVLRHLLATLTCANPWLRCLIRHSKFSLTFLIAKISRTTLENRLMAFYSDYRTHIVALQVFTKALLNDEDDEITRNHIDTMLEAITAQTNGKLEELDEIINEFQKTYCKEN